MRGLGELEVAEGVRTQVELAVVHSGFLIEKWVLTFHNEKAKMFLFRLHGLQLEKLKRRVSDMTENRFWMEDTMVFALGSRLESQE